MADEGGIRIFKDELLFARVWKALDNPLRMGLDRLTAGGLAADFEAPVQRAAGLRPGAESLKITPHTAEAVLRSQTKNYKKPVNLWQYAAACCSRIRRKRHETFRNP
ncbi:MAG: hypothetical protein ISN29_10805 [Gammaproteobacteria bacterium AqS3]|nr:hypothetical protein [Gammaproteobacteria bacterium AqS3]